MKLSRIWAAFLAALLFVGVLNCIACSKDSKDDDDEKTPDSDPTDGPTGQLAVGMNFLPGVTDKVVATPNLVADSAEAKFNEGAGTLAIEGFDLAGTGIPLDPDKISTSTFSGLSNPSRGACELVTHLQGAFQQAAKGDLELCELTESAYENNPEANYVDGQFHVFKMTAWNGSKKALKIKMEGTKDNVTAMTLFSCLDDEQVMFFDKALDADRNITIKMIRTNTRSDGELGLRRDADKIELTSKVNEDGDYEGIKKFLNISKLDFGDDGTFDRHNKYVFTQSKDYMQVMGYTRQDPDVSRLLAYFKLLDTNEAGKLYDLRKLSIGKGAAILSSAATGQGATVGWDSDGNVDDSAPEKVKITALEDDFPDAPAVTETVEFVGDQIWDCSYDDASAVTIDDDHGDDDDDDDDDEYNEDEGCNQRLAELISNTAIECSGTNEH